MKFQNSDSTLSNPPGKQTFWTTAILFALFPMQLWGSLTYPGFIRSRTVLYPATPGFSRDVCKDEFKDFILVFNNIIPDILGFKLKQLTMASPTCQKIADFLTDRREQVSLGSIRSNTHTISTGAPQGFVLSPLLFSLYMNECTSGHPSVKLLKLADNNDKSAYRWKAEQLGFWCCQYSWKLNMLKTVDRIVD
ncbi:hypothetical protein L3Q82_014716 [Scortum barcoo]|uniref:Uncharacterized protein n=1 Tax=Scortum barcoo TaxID=214431 RepID=A0ACB8VSX8_9TELE|nr:hypothetical protein L3Q82_014716 [Scortum barcoo]